MFNIVRQVFMDRFLDSEDSYVGRQGPQDEIFCSFEQSFIGLVFDYPSEGLEYL